MAVVSESAKLLAKGAKPQPLNQSLHDQHVPTHTLQLGEIATTNVLPAFEASLLFGLSEDDAEKHLGWTRELLCRQDAQVSGRSTYEHFELMHARPHYADFVLEAVALHTAKSLGVVGLACKTASTVQEALTCHARFQALTNRTVVYVPHLDGDTFILQEERPGPNCLGRMLVAEYAQLVAVQLLRSLTSSPLTVLACHTERADLPAPTQAAFSKFLGATMSTGAPQCCLAFPSSFLTRPILNSDPELSAYFTHTLDAALPQVASEPPVVQNARSAIRDGLSKGACSLQDIALQKGVSSRTLQRQLNKAGVTFAELLESTRQRLASAYLDNPSLTVAEVSYLLGYSEQSSFFRAFRAWQGTTPSQYRRGLSIETNKS